MTHDRNPPPAPPAMPSRRAVLAGGIAVSAWSLAGSGSARTLTAGRNGADVFTLLRARPGSARLRGDSQAETPIWGYEGEVPGPLLRVRRDEEIRLRLTNETPEATAIHWHGLRLPNAMDGVPHLTQAPVEPRGSFDYRFTARDAGTFWYHASSLAGRRAQRGLYGVLIVDEVGPVEADRDIVLVLDDWRLRPDGTLDAEGSGPAPDAARGASHLTVNSRPSLDIPVRTNERVRLRLLNAAEAQLLGVQIDGHQPVVMAIDGQPAEPFSARDGRVVLGPGNRVDLFVDMQLGPGASSRLIVASAAGQVPIARLVYGGSPARPAPRPEPKPLPANPLPARMDFARALKIDVPLDANGTRAQLRAPRGQGAAPGPPGAPSARIWTPSGAISARGFGPPMFSVQRGRTVMLAFVNSTAFARSIHVHGHHFRLLDALDDGWKPYWLDTLLVLPDQTARIAFVAESPGKWILHGQTLDHPGDDMAAWFQVT